MISPSSESVRSFVNPDVPEEIDGRGRLFFRLKVAQGICKATLDAAFEEVGLTTTQFLALAAIENHADASSAELARRSFVTPQAMIVNITRLEATGLIERSPAPGGGRSLETRLTPKGAELLARAKERTEGIERYIREAMGDSCIAALNDGLLRLTSALTSSVTVTTSRPWDAYCRND